MSTVDNNSSSRFTVSNEIFFAALKKSVEDIEHVCGEHHIDRAPIKLRNGLIFIVIQFIALAGTALAWKFMAPGTFLYLLTAVCAGFLLSTKSAGLTLALEGARTQQLVDLLAQVTQEYNEPTPDFNAEQARAIGIVFGNYDQATHGPWKMRLLCHNISLFQHQAITQA